MSGTASHEAVSVRHGPVDRIFAVLSRESSSGQFVPEIDGLRFVAIMAVVLYHLKGFTVRTLGLEWRSDPLAVFLDKGGFGVQLFFVISGFIIAHPFAQRMLRGEPGVPLGRYLTRRLTRLEPPYIINLVVVFLLLVTARGETIAELWPHLLSSMFYLHNAIYGAHSLINGVAWSLEIECQFYLLAPLLVSVFRIPTVVRRRVTLVIAIAAASIASEIHFTGNPRVELSLLNFLGYFLTGFLLADLHIVSWTPNPGTKWAWDVVGLGSWAGLAALLYAPAPWLALAPLPILGAYCAAFRGPVSNRIFRNRLVYTIGGMCYTIYLYHFFVISALGPVPIDFAIVGQLPVWGALLVMAALVVPPVIVLCAVIFAFTEKPFMRRHWPVAVRNRLALLVERRA